MRHAPRLAFMLARLGVLSLALLLLVAAPTALHAQADADADPAAEAEAPAFEPALIDPAADPEILTLRVIPLTADELSDLAGVWQGIVRAATEEIVEKRVELAEAAGEGAALREEIDALSDERRRLFASYDAVLSAWEKKGGDEAAIAGHRAWRSSILAEETRTLDAATVAMRTLRWVTDAEGGVALGIRIAVIVGSLIALMAVARIVRAVVRGWLGKVRGLSRLLQAFLAVTAYWLVLAFGLLVVLSSLGVDVTPLFALIGGASFILAFALQSTLGNLAAGLMIMLNRPFDEGDFVDVGGVAGTVRSVSIMSTTVTTPDNQIITIPNGQVWGNVITNVTASDIRRVDLTFGIGYGDDMAAAQEVLKALVAAHPKVLKDPEPAVMVGALGASSVDFLVRPWARTEDYWGVHWDLTRQVKEAFDARGISIPFPQQDVHLHLAGPAAAAAAAAASQAPAAGIAEGAPGRDEVEEPSAGG